MAERRQWRHKDLICRKCDKECKNRKELFQHLEEEHFHPKHLHKCQRCSYQSTRGHNLKRHMELVHTRRNRSPSPNATPIPKIKCKLPERMPRTEVPANQLTSSPALSLSCSPTFDGEVLPTIRISGKPLAMLKRSYEEMEDNSSSSIDTDDDTIPDAPDPVAPLAQTSLSFPTSDTEVPPKTAPTEDTILATVVEKKTTRYYIDGIVIRQTDITNTYPVSIPASWNKDVVCNYGMQKD
ncbi:uncharacterized protein LOC135155044 [Lytechinus pictus]|uniref:uncharacterized protein LOC135155044 n=1 Tax=Lytechinus pictus TaxID=7653 RepID=UPI0030BA09CC